MNEGLKMGPCSRESATEGSVDGVFVNKSEDKKWRLSRHFLVIYLLYCAKSLKRLLLKTLDILIDTSELARNSYSLRAGRRTLAAAYAVVCLAYRRDGFVVIKQIFASCLVVVFMILAYHVCAGIYMLVVEAEDTWNVDTVRTRHAVLTCCTAYKRVVLHLVCDAVKEFDFLFVQGFEIKESVEVILEVFHICHTAKCSEYSRETADKAEGP